LVICWNDRQNDVLDDYEPWWEDYSELNFRDVMIVEFSSNGTKIKFFKN
jgi:hypothetical protein